MSHDYGDVLSDIAIQLGTIASELANINAAIRATQTDRALTPKLVMAAAQVKALGQAAKAVCWGCHEGWPLREHDVTAGDGVPTTRLEHDPEGRQSGWLNCTAKGIHALLEEE